MKTLLCIANCALFVCGCVQPQHPLETSRTRSPLLLMQETTTFVLKGLAIEVRFTRSDSDLLWMIYFRDTQQNISEHEHMVAKEAPGSSCTQEDIAAALDQALERFADHHPHAKVDSLCLDMHLSRDLWEELCADLRQRMASLNDAMGAETGEGLDGSSELRRHVWAILEGSGSVTQIKSVLKKHGLRVQFVGAATPILFDDALKGKKWSEIARLPSLGIVEPGVIEFNFGSSGAAILNRHLRE